MILITGASGFIGGHLARRLQDAGHRLILCSHTRDIAADFPRQRCLRLDLSDAAQLRQLPTQGIDAVIHLASRIPAHVSRDTSEDARACLHANIASTLNTLDFASQTGVRRFLFASSVSVYDHRLFSAGREDGPAYPGTFYGWSKLSSEILCEKFRRDAGLSCFSFRMSSVYGPGQEEHLLISRFMRRARSGEDIHVWGQGTKCVDYVYIDDVVRAFEHGLSSGDAGVYNIGSGEPSSVAELARLVVRIFGDGSSSVVFDPEKDGDDSSRITLDISKAGKLLGFRPAYTLERGLEEFRNRLWPAPSP